MLYSVQGDATHPVGDGPKIIVHVVNDVGVWGAGFVLALSKRWSDLKEIYREYHQKTLGSVQFVFVEDDILVANMCAQHGLGRHTKPIRYDALRRCLMIVNERAESIGATIHGPRFGAGLAGGDWETIESIIQEVCTVPVYIYDLPRRDRG
jgi:O-acetyl-ADP-ribose deacetylase (regulator of RNase III)